MMSKPSAKFDAQMPSKTVLIPCTPVDIKANLKKYLRERDQTARYSSFDYCFNYFQAYREAHTISKISSPANLELSCVQLGFYLASWGMLRASSTLLQKSMRHYVPVIRTIASIRPEVWKIDAHDYTESNIASLMQIADRLRSSLHDGASDTLVTKIMLGVFGCVPAFDNYFCSGFGTWSMSSKAFRRIGLYYKENSETIENYRVPTIDFSTGRPTKRKYTRAKVIDMIFWEEGLSKSENSKALKKMMSKSQAAEAT
jgi:hypothetical protein